MLKIIKSFFKTCTEAWEEYSKREAGQYEINEAFFKARRDGGEIKPLISNRAKSFVKRRLYISRPFSVTKELVIDKIMKDLKCPHCPKCKIGFVKVKDDKVIPIFNVLYDGISEGCYESEAERSCDTCGNRYPLKADCHLCNRVNLDRWVPSI